MAISPKVQSPLDALRSTGQLVPPSQQPGAPTNLTGAMERLSTAASGKAVGPTTAPRLSNIQEQVANQQAALAGADIAEKARQQALELEQRERARVQEEEVAKEELNEKELLERENYFRQVDEVLRQYQTGQKQLSVSRDKAQLEQVGIILRLKNNQYIKQLQDQGRRARLDNRLRFNEELAKALFAEELSLFEDDLNFRSMMNANARDFTEQLSNIDLDFAMKMAAAENREASQQMVWTGVGNVISGGLQAYEASQKQNPKEPKP